MSTRYVDLLTIGGKITIDVDASVKLGLFSIYCDDHTKPTIRLPQTRPIDVIQSVQATVSRPTALMDSSGNLAMIEFSAVISWTYREVTLSAPVSL